MTPAELPQLTLEALQAPGPLRSAATSAIAARLRAELAVCRDRSLALAPGLLDAGLAAAIGRVGS